MIRRFGAPKQRNRQYTPRPGAYAILALGRDVLITHQGGPFDEYQLPGGGIDSGESPIAALHREVMEETGWSIQSPRRLGAYRRFTYMPEYDLWAEKVCHIFLATPVRRISDPLEADHTAVWSNVITATRVLHSEGDRHFLRSYVRDL
ncbi:NUDIX hydrolase [Aliiroseovarius sp. F20344]|uniref:NUDIX hydrolase n=1 Tax=Aliiroseovarius sp. F20344 TaxID=2926414 RepID=UPI001FF37005|nr:NUDIX hydrolase [Aliiroseovarius sp. F20344]MCK0141377.1 NUDIX hydrolase [Aliiroseovarius sp. F20344]